MEPGLVAWKREDAPQGRPKSADCHIKVPALHLMSERRTVGSGLEGKQGPTGPISFEPHRLW